MKIGRPTEVAEARVELVPLIDCVFLLLIFFMCAATMSKVDTPTSVKLPVASNAAKQTDPSRRGTVNVMPPGSVTPAGEVATAARPFLVYGKLVDDDGLQRLMAEHLKAEPNMRLYLRADHRVHFAVVRRAMAACAAAGVSDVIFATFLRELYLKEE